MKIYSNIFNLDKNNMEKHKTDLIENIKFIQAYNKNETLNTDTYGVKTELGLTSVSYLSVKSYVELYGNKKLSKMIKEVTKYTKKEIEKVNLMKQQILVFKALS